MKILAEFTVEPFVPGAPGPHVEAALQAARDTGATVEIGPFGNAVSSDDEATVRLALGEAIRAGLAAGATRVTCEVRQV